jgi:hypothetical protein
MGRKAVVEAVTRRAFGKVDAEARGPERLLEDGFVKVVAAELPAYVEGINSAATCWQICRARAQRDKKRAKRRKR